MRTAASVGAARVAVVVTFLCNGAVFGTWVSRIPDVQMALDLSPGALGTALLAIAIGAFVAMPTTGRLLIRFDSKPITVIGGVAFCALLPMLATAPTFAALTIMLAAFGAANGVLDVAMNAQAVSVERSYRRTIMPSFHASFSLGGLVGAVCGALVAGQGVSVLAHFVAVGIAGTALLLVSAGRLPPSAVSAESPGMARPVGPLLPLGVMAFAVLLCEGAVADWAAVYLSSELQLDTGLAPLGYAAFSLAMAAGRLSGDWMARWAGPVPLVRYGGMLATAGLAAAVLLEDPIIAIIGFGVAGLGLSIVFPLIITAAVNTPGFQPGPAVAAMSTVGYTGFLAGPVAIGYIAEASTLRTALLVVVGLAALIAVFSRAARAADMTSVGR